MATGIAVGMGGEGPAALPARQQVAGQSRQQQGAVAIVGDERKIVQAGVYGTCVAQSQKGM